ncbi:MAG: membrane protein insertase YidC [Nocardioidaceae bacterium]
MGFLSTVGTAIMTPLYYLTSSILIFWHFIFEQVFGSGSGWTWALSIIGLTVTIRAALIPLFVRQIKASRNMQLLQPKVKELQKKYGHDREHLTQETMKLYKESGTNPFASCLPLLLQAPIFFALFRMINHAVHDEPKGVLSLHDATLLHHASIFGAQISDTFNGATSINVRILTAFLVVLMTATTFLTQRQLMRKNMPKDALSGPYAQQQKMLLYVLPVVFAVGGIAFPVGVLLYWTTSNLWTMSQQFYVIRNNPAPGTPAFEAKRVRDLRHGRTPTVEPDGGAGDEPVRLDKPRVQPKKQTRAQRRSGAAPKPGAVEASAGAEEESADGLPGADGGAGADETPPAQQDGAPGSGNTAANGKPRKQRPQPKKKKPQRRPSGR